MRRDQPASPQGSVLLGGVDAVALRGLLAAGELGCVEVARAFLEACGEDSLNAWAELDVNALLARAAALDGLGEAERKQLPLFGVPVGIKDNFDTSDLPTGYGSPIYAGWQPAADSETVRRLRSAGAMIAGKLKCAEFGWMHPPDTVNPLDWQRTPGGSSSGSAAAVAAGTVPLATGTQTAGSINRPASYCGVLGYKPTFGAFPRDGVKLLADSLDTVGLFARSVTDLQLVSDVLVAADPRTSVGLDSAPRLALARTPLWSAVEPASQAAIEAAVRAVRETGTAMEEVELPGGFEELVDAQTTIQFYESAISLAPELASSGELLSDELRAALIEGTKIPAERHAAAKRATTELAPALIELLERYDGVLTPSATGVPPKGLSFTGDPLFCRVWTLIGAPSISVPLAWTEEPLPAGLQLVGAPGSDGRTLAAAGWLMERLGSARR
jgi:Asp-tRNA(Asn)/Glu-tRNA(Gln) amidotransferase A subunit family amidase